MGELICAIHCSRDGSQAGPAYGLRQGGVAHRAYMGICTSPWPARPQPHRDGDLMLSGKSHFPNMRGAANWPKKAVAFLSDGAHHGRHPSMFGKLRSCISR